MPRWLALCELLICGEAMQVADRERLFHITLPAALFTQPRTDTPQGCGQREVVRDDLCGLPVVACGNALDEVGDVQPGRASCLAGADAIACMVGEQQFQRGLAGQAHLLRVVNNHHSFRYGRGAGRPQVGPAFDLHRAQEARGRGLEALDVAEGGDGKPELARRGEDRGAGGTVTGRPSIRMVTEGVIAARNPKAEGRGPKEGRSPKAEIRSGSARGAWSFSPYSAEDEV